MKDIANMNVNSGHRKSSHGASTPLRQKLAVLLSLVGLVFGFFATPAFAADEPGATAANEINGLVWLDRNKDGVNDADEIGFPGAIVTLIDEGSGAEVGTVTTGADGLYSFPGLSGGPFTVKVETDKATYPEPSNFIPSFSGPDQDVSQSAADTRIGEAKGVSPGTAVNAGWSPRPELRVGSVAVVDGTPPFGDASDGCNSPTDKANAGSDCGPGNMQVRTQDIVSTEWSVTANNFEDINHNEGPVVFEQTLYPADDAKVTFKEELPASCKPANNGGYDTPASEIIENADGTVTLRCNLGEFTEGGQKAFTTIIDVTNASPNGSSFTTDARVYMPDENNADVDRAKPDKSEMLGPIEISSAPAYDVSKEVQATFPTQIDIDRNGDGDTDDPGEKDVSGMYVVYFLNIAQERKTGIEPIVQPITLGDAVTATDHNGNPLPDLEYYITKCYPSKYISGNHPGGKIGGALYKENSVIDSGTCSYARANPADNKSPYEFTIDGADLSGASFPVKSARSGGDYSSGPYYVISHQFEVFVPAEVVDAEDGAADGNGEITLLNHFTDFDPDGLSGTSNYGDGFEPGYCRAAGDCDQMNDPADPRSNNTKAAKMRLSTRGSYSKYLRDKTDIRGIANSTLSGQTEGHGGDSEVEPTEDLHSVLVFQNSGTNPLKNPEVCDVFDNTVFQLTDSSAVSPNGPDGKHAYVGQYNAAGSFDTWPDNFKIQYAVTNLSGDDPLSGGAVDPVTGRYEGTWTAQAAASEQCGGPNVTWYDDVASVPGGIDSINMVRAIAKDPNFALPGGTQARLIVPLIARDNFNGGPHDGEMIPMGTVLANYGNRAWDNPDGSRNYGAQTYLPSPENSSVTGDRTTMSRVKIKLTKESIEPKAGYQASASTLAGNQIIWKVNAAVQSNLATGAPATNVVIIDELPAEVTYNASCTANAAGGTPPDVVKPNTNRDGQPEQGKTLLIWNLGDLPANTPVPPRIICTDSDPMVPNNTPTTNYAEVRADNVVTPLAPRSDEHTINLEQTGGIKTAKRVDRGLDPVTDEQIHTLEFANFSTTSKTVKPVVIDVLPWNGDGQGSLNERDPASKFTGTVTLKDVPVATWSDDSVPGAGEKAMGVYWFTADDPATIDYNPDANKSTWCSYDGTSFTKEVDNGGACPAALSDATAFRFNSNYDLETDGNVRQGMKIVITLDAKNNAAGDFYANRFGFDSTTLPADQFLRSNTVTVQVEGFELGDLIFIDTNNDGKFTKGTDTVAPEGVSVEVYADNDGTPGPSAGDKLVTTVKTNADGRWHADKLGPGDYYVRVPASEFAAGGKLAGYDVQPKGFEADPNTDVNDPKGDHHASTTGTVAADGVVTPVITLSTEPVTGPLDPILGSEPLADNTGGLTTSVNDDFTNFTLDMALRGAASLGDRVWADENGDGVQDPGEPGLAGATVTATWFGPDGKPGGGDDVVYTTTTDANGNYKFEGLLPGDYKVDVSDVSPELAATFDLDGGNDSSAKVTLGAGENKTDVDFGYQPKFSLGDRVWVDGNGDGKYDPATDAAAPAGTKVELMNADGTPTGKSVETDANGNYKFTDLPAGDYYVQIPADALTGPLDRAKAAPNGVADPNNDADEADDHNAIDDPSGAIKTGVIKLSATYSDTPGAQVTGDEPDGFANNTLDLALEIVPAAPAIKVVKRVQGDDANDAPGVLVEAGKDVVWSFEVMNMGNVKLTDVSVSDKTLTDAGATISCPKTELGIDETMVCNASPVKAVAGQATNTATASGTGPETYDLNGNPTPGAVVTADDPANYFGAEPKLEFTKYVQGEDANDAPGVYMPPGQDVVWAFKVVNVGNVDLTDVVVSDPTLTDLGATISCPSDKLTIAGAMICTASPVKSTAGQQTNTASVSGTGPETVGPGGEPVPGKTVTDDDPANYFGAEPSIDVEKYIVVDGVDHDADAAPGPSLTVGSVASWKIVVTNTGNVPLLNVAVEDPKMAAAGAKIECAGGNPIATLPAGAVVECTVSAKVTEAGVFTNTASATGTPPEMAGPDGKWFTPDKVTDSDPANYNGEKLVRPGLPPETGAAGTETPVTGFAVLLAAGLALLGLRRRTS